MTTPKSVHRHLHLGGGGFEAEAKDDRERNEYSLVPTNATFSISFSPLALLFFLLFAGSLLTLYSMRSHGQCFSGGGRASELQIKELGTKIDTLSSEMNALRKILNEL